MQSCRQPMHPYPALLLLCHLLPCCPHPACQPAYAHFCTPCPVRPTHPAAKERGQRCVGGQGGPHLHAQARCGRHGSGQAKGRQAGAARGGSGSGSSQEAAARGRRRRRGGSSWRRRGQRVMRGKGGCAGSTTRLLVTVDDMAGVACSSEADPAVPPNPAAPAAGPKVPGAGQRAVQPVPNRGPGVPKHSLTCSQIMWAVPGSLQAPYHIAWRRSGSCRGMGVIAL